MGFFQTFPDWLPTTTIQRRLPCPILWSVKILNYWPKKNYQLPQNQDYKSDPFDPLPKFSFQEMRNQQVSNLHGSKSSIWSCAPSSPSAKKGITAHAMCGTITCFQTHQLPVKTGQQEPRTEASLSCLCTIQRHCRDTELTRNTNLNYNGEEFRMQAPLPVTHHPTPESFQEAGEFFICYPRLCQMAKWLRSNSHWHTPPLEWYSIQRACQRKSHVTVEQKSLRKSGFYPKRQQTKYILGLGWHSNLINVSDLNSAKHFVWSLA